MDISRKHAIYRALLGDLFADFEINKTP